VAADDGPRTPPRLADAAVFTALGFDLPTFDDDREMSGVPSGPALELLRQLDDRDDLAAQRRMSTGKAGRRARRTTRRG
jgi:hypothetical protein